MWKLKAMGCIMAKCKNCNLEILDETVSCPLCQSILEPTVDVENMYPDVRLMMRRFTLLTRIYLFVALVAEAALFTINLVTFHQYPLWWSAITGLVLLYAYLVLRYAVVGKTGYKSKVLVLSLIAVLTTIAIDLVTGYRGWSVDYVLPGGILMLDVVIIGCMIYNRRNWQSYMMWQLLMVLCSILPIALYILGLERNEYLAFLPMACSATLFLGTLIIGDRRARTELKRRFHLN